MNNDINFIRKEVDRLQTKMSNFDVTTEYAYSDSDTEPPIASATWSTEKPAPMEGKFIWARNIMNMGYGDVITEPYCIGDGLEHILSLDVEYIAWSDPYQAPSHDNPYWQTTAPSIQSGQYIWTRTVVVTTNGTNYTDPVRITGLQGERGQNGIDGKSGKDGKGIEFIFYLSNTKIDDWNDEFLGIINPASLNPIQRDDYVPKPWTDDQSEVTEEFPFQYVCTRTKSLSDDGVTGEWSKFNTPKLWSVYGEKPYCHIRYADVNNPLQWSQTYAYPQTSSNNEIAYHKYEGYLWNNDEVLQDADKDPTKFSWRIYRPTIGIAGEEGSFLHIQFADDEAGTNMNQYDGAYMGTCVTYEEVDPDDPDLYNWVRIRGTEGNGTEFVYYTTSNANYISLPSNIQNTPALNKWCERPYAVSEANPYCYISMREYIDETWGSWSSPVLWAKYGATGQQGVQGEKGEDGEGLEMIFARNNSTTTAPTFTNNQNKASFTGKVNNKSYQDTDFVPQGWTDNQSGVDSSNAVEWVCMRFKRPNSNGDGVWGDFNTPRVWATYSEDGRSVVSIQEQYALSDSYYTAPTTGWSNTPPTNVQGKFYWTRSVITYDSGSPLTSTTTPICVSGLDGTGVNNVFYCTNTLSTPSTPTWANVNNNSSTASQNYNKWVKDPVEITATYRYIYISTSTDYVKSDGSWKNFSAPVLWSRYALDGTNGTNGTNGTGYEYAYYTSNSATAPTKPSGTVTATTGTGKWTTVPIPMTSTYKYMYISYRTKTGTTYSAWSNSALWSQFGDKGDQGARGIDGIGLEHIFYRSKTPINSWGNNNTNPAYWSAVQTDDYVMSGTGWTDNATGVDSTWLYEYCAIRTKSPNANGVGVWSKFTTPSLWAKFGEQGEQGLTGVHGDNVSSSEVVDKVTDQSFSNSPVGSVSNSVPSDFIANTVKGETFTRGSARCLVPSWISSGEVIAMRQGNIVMLNVNNLNLTSSFPIDTSGTHTEVFTLPDWAKPSNIIYFPSVLDNSVLSVSVNHFRIRRLSNFTNMSGTITYFVDSETGKLPSTLSWVSTSAVNQGGNVQVKLMGNGSVLDGAKVYFRVNSRLYTRTTNSSGIASLNINLPNGNYPIIAWYDGGEYNTDGVYEGQTGSYAYAELTDTTFTVNKASTVNIAFGSDSKGYFARFTNTTGSYPIRYHTASLNINNTGAFNVETDGDGKAYYKLTGMSGSVSVTASISSSERITTGKSASTTHTV